MVCAVATLQPEHDTEGLFATDFIPQKVSAADSFQCLRCDSSSRFAATIPALNSQMVMLAAFVLCVLVVLEPVFTPQMLWHSGMPKRPARMPPRILAQSAAVILTRIQPPRSSGSARRCFLIIPNILHVQLTNTRNMLHPDARHNSCNLIRESFKQL
jgi:hypothetical protein